MLMMKYNLIAVSGKKNSGKNTVCEIIKSFQSLEGKTYEIKGFADKLKESLTLTWGISPAALDDRKFKESMHPILDITWRELMQKYGEYMRFIDPDYWVKALFSEYKPTIDTGYTVKWDSEFIEDHVYTDGNNHYTAKYPNWLICDLRYKNEANYLKEKGALLIRVSRSNIENNNHISETDLDDYKFDEVIDNNSDIQSLIEKIKIILEKENIL